MHFTEHFSAGIKRLRCVAVFASACLIVIAALAGCASRPIDGPLARDMVEYRIRAAEKIQAANPQLGFAGELPDPLASIPVVQVLLHADGSVKRIEVLRTPSFYPETVQTAIQAIERAQPFGSVAHLPQPWQFSETFLFNEDLKFQLRTLVELTAEK